MNLITLLRSYRIGPFAIFDFAMSYIVVYLIAPYLQKIGLKLSRAQMLWLTLPVSILIHILVKQNTPLTEMFLDLHGGYAAKIVTVFMIVMAFRKKH
jgi:hypothetical protein